MTSRNRRKSAWAFGKDYFPATSCKSWMKAENKNQQRELSVSLSWLFVVLSVENPSDVKFASLNSVDVKFQLEWQYKQRWNGWQGSKIKLASQVYRLQQMINLIINLIYPPKNQGILLNMLNIIFSIQPRYSELREEKKTWFNNHGFLSCRDDQELEEDFKKFWEEFRSSSLEKVSVTTC